MLIVKMGCNAKHLLNLHHEMDRFEALYVELHTHVARSLPPELHSGSTTRRVSYDVLSIDECSHSSGDDVRICDNGRENSVAPVHGIESKWTKDLDSEMEEGQDIGEFTSRKGSGSMTNLFVEGPDLPCEELTGHSPQQELWSYLTNMSFVFNRMRYFLVSSAYHSS